VTFLDPTIKRVFQEPEHVELALDRSATAVTATLPVLKMYSLVVAERE
jgi:hypothetical protein